MNTQLIVALLAGIAIGIAGMSGFFFQKQMPYQVLAPSSGNGLIKFSKATGQVWLLGDIKRGWIEVGTQSITNGN